MSKIKVECVLDKFNMTEEEYINQAELTCEIEEHELLEIVAEKLGVKAEDICTQNFFITIID